MSSSLCIRCAMSKLIAPARPAIKRSIHTTRSLKKKGDRAEVMTEVSATIDLSNPKSVTKKKKRSGAVSRRDVKPYTAEEKARLAKKYTPAQLSAIEAGEAAVDSSDLFEQGAVRYDPYALKYQHEDDLSKIIPVIDKPIPAPEENWDPKARFKTEDEIASDLGDFLKNLPEEPSAVDFQRFHDNVRLKVGKEEAERNPRTYVRPPIPRGIPTLEARVRKPEEFPPEMTELMATTGLNPDQISGTRNKILVRHRVVNMTRLGRVFSAYRLCVVGNGKGMLGIGEAKKQDTAAATKAAYMSALKNMRPIPRYEERTIYGDVKVKFGAVELELMNRPPGFGIRCSALIHEMCKCAGIEDMAARNTRSRNKMNTIKAAFKAFTSQRVPDEVARGLGRKLVDVRKVYYSGATYDQ